MVLDSGSDITIIHSKPITDDQLTGETVTVHTVDDRPIHFPLARVCLHVGHYSIDHVVAVSHTIKDDALLGVDLPGDGESNSHTSTADEEAGG